MVPSALCLVPVPRAQQGYPLLVVPTRLCPVSAGACGICYPMLSNSSGLPGSDTQCLVVPASGGAQ